MFTRGWKRWIKRATVHVSIYEPSEQRIGHVTAARFNVGFEFRPNSPVTQARLIYRRNKIKMGNYLQEALLWNFFENKLLISVRLFIARRVDKSYRRI